ncbi:pikachurin [Apis cerana cerana]|uniref:Pikachurin n=1 Tax=Apis cerana cerana TaxID=94128 RepID=A0A2A3EL25_APICC|nr:pikachurin [Apis cerana cerana]
MEMIEIDGNQRGKKRRSFVSYRHGNGNFARIFKAGGKVWSVGKLNSTSPSTGELGELVEDVENDELNKDTDDDEDAVEDILYMRGASFTIHLDPPPENSTTNSSKIIEETSPPVDRVELRATSQESSVDLYRFGRRIIRGGKGSLVTVCMRLRIGNSVHWGSSQHFDLRPITIAQSKAFLGRFRPTTRGVRTSIGFSPIQIRIFITYYCKKEQFAKKVRFRYDYLVTFVDTIDQFGGKSARFAPKLYIYKTLILPSSSVGPSVTLDASRRLQGQEGCGPEAVCWKRKGKRGQEGSGAVPTGIKKIMYVRIEHCDKVRHTFMVPVIPFHSTLATHSHKNRCFGRWPSNPDSPSGVGEVCGHVVIRA